MFCATVYPYFVFADKLATLNLSYQPPASIIPDILQRILKKLKSTRKFSWKARSRHSEK
jgi:hypothetical protein